MHASTTKIHLERDELRAGICASSPQVQQRGQVGAIFFTDSLALLGCTNSSRARSASSQTRNNMPKHTSFSNSKASYFACPICWKTCHLLSTIHRPALLLRKMLGSFIWETSSVHKTTYNLHILSGLIFTFGWWATRAIHRLWRCSLSCNVLPPAKLVLTYIWHHVVVLSSGNPGGLLWLMMSYNTDARFLMASMRESLLKTIYPTYTTFKINFSAEINILKFSRSGAVKAGPNFRRYENYLYNELQILLQQCHSEWTTAMFESLTFIFVK